jgi:chaperonin GroEL
MFPSRPPQQPPEKKSDFQRPGVVFQPVTARSMLRGMDKILNAVRPTLGPLPRTVAIEHIANREKRPEMLDSGGTIARRIIQLRGRNEDVGAMFIRNVLWSLQEKVGDGTATAAVMFQKIFNDGRRYLVDGGDVMMLKRHFESALPLLLAELDQATRPVSGKKDLAALAMTICHHETLSRYLGEIFDIIGAFGRMEIRTGRSREIEREYVEGLWWDNGVLSREMIFDKFEQKTSLEDAYILISDLEINEPGDLIPLLDLCIRNEVKSLLLISGTLSDRAMSLLLQKPNQEKIKIIAVRSPAISMDVRIDAMQDLAVLTGGTALFKAAGESLNRIKIEQLGRARRVWGRVDNWGFVGGRGDPRAIRNHIAALRKAYGNAKDNDGRKKILNRVSKLIGGSATLWVGGNTPLEVEALKELAERTGEAMRGAMREGVVPGGGVALLDCRTRLRKELDGATDPDKIAAYRILIKALEEPFRVIVQNSGGDLDEIFPLVKQAGAGYGYDVLKREVVDVAAVGLFDAASVVKGAVHAAISGAALALTTDVMIHRKNPPESLAGTD